MVHEYIDDVLFITENNCEDHLKSSDRVLQILAEAGLKVNAEKSFFRKIETGYLDFSVSNTRVRPFLSKVEAIKAINVPTKVHDVWSFLVLVNDYRDMWRKCAHTLSPLKNYVQQRLISNRLTCRTMLF